MAKKKTEKAERYVLLANGEKHAITGEEGRYYICGDIRFRKANVTVEKAPAVQEKTEPEAEPETAPEEE